MPKFKNSNATFWVIFKQCVQGVPASFGLTPCTRDLLDMVSDALWEMLKMHLVKVVFQLLSQFQMVEKIQWFCNLEKKKHSRVVIIYLLSLGKSFYSSSFFLDKSLFAMPSPKRLCSCILNASSAVSEIGCTILDRHNFFWRSLFSFIDQKKESLHWKRVRFLSQKVDFDLSWQHLCVH